VHYVTRADAAHFQPANISFGLLPEVPETMKRKIKDRRERRRVQVEDALAAMQAWIAGVPDW
jgi:methylenetetrahydrofolate--tRNA-(uracil-5-)-methyltransferase